MISNLTTSSPIAIYTSSKRSSWWNVLMALVLFMIAGAFSTVRAADWYLQAIAAGNWYTLTDWWSQLESGGAHPASISSADRFFSNGFELRTPATSSATVFGGGALIMNGGTLACRGTSSTSATTVGNFVSYGCQIYNLNYSGSVTQLINFTNFTNHGSTWIHPSNVSASSCGMIVTVGTLRGNGDITLISDATGGIKFSVTNASNYYGTIYTTGAQNIAFQNAMASGGTLVIPSGANITLNANIAFAAFVHNGVVKSAGIYNAATLGFTGTGSVTVVNPGEWYLHATQPGTDNWNTLTDWFSATTGGTNPTAINSRDVFYTNGFFLRTPFNALGAVFGGKLLKINAAGNMGLYNTSNTTSTTIGNLEIAGGTISVQQNVNSILNVSSILASGTGSITTITSTRGLILSTDILRGAGNITVNGVGGGTLNLSVADASNYTGTIALNKWSTGTTTFNSDLFCGGKLDVGTGNSVVVNKPISLAGLTVSGVAKAAGTYTAAALGFTGSGNVTVTNRPTQMFGVNLPYLTFALDDPANYPSDADLAYYQSKGQTLIRLGFKWERIQPTLMGSLNTTRLTYLQNFVGWANARGMKVILDMHNYGKYNGNAIGTTTVSYAAYQDVWTKIATAFSTSTAIWAYDIMNEPQLTSAVWQTAAQYAVNGIRSVDSTHFIMLEGVNWSSATMWPTVNGGLINVTDPQKKLVYSAHCYFANSGNDQYGTYDAEGGYPNKGIDKVTPFVEWCKSRKVYGHIGEYGVPWTDARWNVMLQNFLQYLEDNGISGTYWAGGAWSATYSLSIQPTSNYTVDKPQMSVVQLFGQ